MVGRDYCLQEINTEGRMSNHLLHLAMQPRLFTCSVRACALVMAKSECIAEGEGKHGIYRDETDRRDCKEFRNDWITLWSTASEGWHCA